MRVSRLLAYGFLCAGLVMTTSAIEPVTMMVAGGIGVASMMAAGLWESIRCRVTSCCNDRWIVKNFTGLEHDLTLKLHGQHLVQRTILGHLKGHLLNQNPSKALVLSFHGFTGVGKNFVSSIIAENVYVEGLRSPYVHLIPAASAFPHQEMLPIYKDQLKSWIEGNTSVCDRSMFIFDEVDKFPATLMDVVKPYVDYYEQLGGRDYRKNIFILLSNTGGNDIGNMVLTQWKEGSSRESIKLSNLENIVMKAAVNADNHDGLWHCQLIGSQLITAYIPFLPLEKSHVRKCIIDSLLSRKYYADASKIEPEVIDEVMDELTFFPQAEKVFSSTGCKRVSEKVDYVMIGRSKHPGV